jgi:two-component system chemotaxis response regulator CheY
MQNAECRIEDRGLFCILHFAFCIRRAMRMKILLVEDSASMRSYLSNVIESGTEEDGVEIVEAANGFEALKLLPHHKFDAILTDINMPDINGLELVSFLKNHPIYKTIPIMVISTESTAEDRKRAAALGAEEYLAKPFEAPELVDKLRRMLKVA